MKMLSFFLMVTLVAAAILMCDAIEGTISRLLIVGAVVLGIVLPLGYGAYKEWADQ